MDLICIVEVDWLGFRLDPGPLAGRIVGDCLRRQHVPFSLLMIKFDLFFSVNLLPACHCLRSLHTWMKMGVS